MIWASALFWRTRKLAGRALSKSAQNVLPAAMDAAVIRALLTRRTHLEAGALVTVDLNRHRIRVLPIELLEELRTGVRGDHTATFKRRARLFPHDMVISESTLRVRNVGMCPRKTATETTSN